MATIKADRPVCAFLDLIAASEGTSTHPLTRADGYDVIVTGIDGPHIFGDFSCHPFALGRKPIVVRAAQAARIAEPAEPGPFQPKVIEPMKPAVESTASGRYQIILPTWETLCSYGRTPTFAPTFQDLAAIQLLAECRALDDLHAGHIAAAIDKACETWGSFPGNPYQQGGRSLDWLLDTYTKCLEAQSV